MQASAIGSPLLFHSPFPGDCPQIFGVYVIIHAFFFKLKVVLFFQVLFYLKCKNF
jgi:hypothetical protein